MARIWIAKVAPSLAETTQAKHVTFLEADVFPWIGARPIAEITAPDLLGVIRRIAERGALDVAKRTHNLCGRVFR